MVNVNFISTLNGKIIEDRMESNIPDSIEDTYNYLTIVPRELSPNVMEDNLMLDEECNLVATHFTFRHWNEKDLIIKINIENVEKNN